MPTNLDSYGTIYPKKKPRKLRSLLPPIHTYPTKNPFIKKKPKTLKDKKKQQKSLLLEIANKYNDSKVKPIIKFNPPFLGVKINF